VIKNNMGSQLFPYVLSIAGHDPSAGAGITSDIKTFDHHTVYGFSVVTAITVQNDTEIHKIQWIDPNLIIAQINILFKSYPIEVVKIGIIENFKILKQLIKHLKRLNPELKIIWDPILKSSSGFKFHNNEHIDNDVFQHLYLITPNIQEFNMIKRYIANPNTVSYLLKGGHLNQNRGTDILHLADEQIIIKGKSFNGISKHGTGCVVSSAIASNLAKGKNLITSCILAKKYVENFILSTENNLGIHQF